jgi:hypothetical protein
MVIKTGVHHAMRPLKTRFVLPCRHVEYRGMVIKPGVHYALPAGSLLYNYSTLVDGDCPRCSTSPPSPLALRWLPRAMHGQYQAFLNVTAAAASGDAICAAALPGFDTSVLMSRMSVYQKARYNGGR